jgi:hypothetical protein
VDGLVIAPASMDPRWVGTMSGVVHAGHTVLRCVLAAARSAVRLDGCAAAPDTNPDTSGRVPARIPHGYMLGVARARWPIRSSKPAGRGSPTVGRFDSCAAPLTKTLQRGHFLNA